MRKAKCLIAFISSLFLPFSTLPANAVYGGTPVTGDSRVVGLVYNLSAPRSGCSGALIAPQIVVSAAHCLGRPGTIYANSEQNVTNIYITQPGVAIGNDEISTRIRVLRAVVKVGYAQIFDPKSGDNPSATDDIAFYFLERPFADYKPVEIASLEEVNRIKMNRNMITHYGYGLQDVGTANGLPYKVTLRAYQKLPNYPVRPPEDRHIATEEIGTMALCAGDSGGPWYADVDGVEKIVAVTTGASGCGGVGSGMGGTLGAVIAPHMYLVKNYFAKFLDEVDSIKAQLRKAEEELALQIREAKLAFLFFQETSSCHSSSVAATLQGLVQGSWVDRSKALGWEFIPTYPGAQCFQPYTIYTPTTGEVLRWKITNPPHWEVFSQPFVENYTAAKAVADKAAAEKAAAAAKAVVDKVSADKAAMDKIIADAKAEVEKIVLAARLSADKIIADAAAAAKKKTTTTCIKGKLTKKITAVKPKCPAGYKKK